MYRLMLLTSLAIQPVTLLAQDEPTKGKRREEFARLRMLSQPGDEHVQLKGFVGSWKVSMKAGGKDTGFNGTAKAETILGDRFMVIDGQGKTGNRE